MLTSCSDIRIRIIDFQHSDFFRRSIFQVSPLVPLAVRNVQRFTNIFPSYQIIRSEFIVVHRVCLADRQRP